MGLLVRSVASGPQGVDQRCTRVAFDHDIGQQGDDIGRFLVRSEQALSEYSALIDQIDTLPAKTVTRHVTSVLVLPLYETLVERPSITEAIIFLVAYNDRSAGLSFVRYEIIVI